MSSSEILRIFLPLRPSALPDAQRLRAWAMRSGVVAQIELCAVLPDLEGPALAIGAFANDKTWVDRRARSVLPAGDWQAINDWARECLPVCPAPATVFSDQGPDNEILPGEFWLNHVIPGALLLNMAPPEWVLLQRAKAAGPRLALAESCTGGGLAARLTALPGSSALLRQGYVTYSNAAKEQMLQVQEHTLARFGAVSEEVALEMLAGALVNADMAVAITGIAGPGGAVSGKAVGTVCWAWGQRGAQAQVKTGHFSGDRWAVQYAAGSVALGALLTLLPSAS
ncbi:MAG: CinA family protein [Acidithiobacillus sp.]